MKVIVISNLRLLFATKRKTSRPLSQHWCMCLLCEAGFWTMVGRGTAVTAD